MNEKAIEKKTESELTPVTSSIGNMLFEPGVFERVTQMSEIMAKSKAMVPQYLRGNQSDCMAIIMQAAQWRMDPFAVASKTYQIKPGAPIAYEAQLVNSVIIINGPFKERPKYEFFGEWSRVQGKLKEMRSDRGKYAVPDWKPEDEEGLGVTVTLQVVGEGEPTSMDVLLKQCWPRHSTNWANDPQQQICYAAIRKMARRHFPDVVMGLYTPEELSHVQPEERDITPNNDVESLLEPKPCNPEDTRDKGTTVERAMQQKQAGQGEEQNNLLDEVSEAMAKVEGEQALKAIAETDAWKALTKDHRQEARSRYAVRLQELREAIDGQDQ